MEKLKKLSDLKRVMEESYYSKEKFDLEKYSNVFFVPVSTLMQKLNIIPGYEVDFALTDQKKVDHYYYDSCRCYFSFYLSKNEEEIGELFKKYYDTEYDDSLDYYITTDTTQRNCVFIDHLLKSSLMLEKFKNPEIIKFLNRDDVQNALWQTISESFKQKMEEKIQSTETSLLIAKHKEAEAKKEVERLQQEKAEQQRNLNEEDFNL